MEGRVGTGESDVTPEQIDQFCQRIAGYFGDTEEIGLQRKIFQSSIELREGYQIHMLQSSEGNKLYSLKIDRYPEDEDITKADSFQVIIDPTKAEDQVVAKYNETWMKKVDGRWIAVDSIQAMFQTMVDSEPMLGFLQDPKQRYVAQQLADIKGAEEVETADFNEQMGLSRFGFTQIKFYEAMELFEKIDMATDVTDQY